MATNKCMIELMEEMIELQHRLSAGAIILRRHIRRQKTLGATGSDNSKYVYNEKRKRYELK